MKIFILIFIYAVSGLEAMGLGRSHSNSSSNYRTEMYMRVHHDIMDRAKKIAATDPNARYIQMIYSGGVMFCKDRSDCFVIKVIDKDNKDIGFMLWGVDKTSGGNTWRLIIYEKTLEDFNNYVRNTPFFYAVIEDASKVIVSIC
jgi:hypothetical protein